MEFLMVLAFFAFMLKLLFLALIVGGVVFVLKRSGRLGRGWERNAKYQFKRMTGEDNALQIARKRFANGEITSEEYEVLKRALT